MGKRVLFVLLITLFFIGMLRIAEAAYPTRPIQIVAAYAAGGATDQISRIMAATLPDFIGQPVMVLRRFGDILGCKPKARWLYSIHGIPRTYHYTIFDDRTSLHKKRFHSACDSMLFSYSCWCLAWQ